VAAVEISVCKKIYSEEFSAQKIQWIFLCKKPDKKEKSNLKHAIGL